MGMVLEKSWMVERLDVRYSPKNYCTSRAYSLSDLLTTDTTTSVLTYLE